MLNITTDSLSPWIGHSPSPQNWLQKSTCPEGGITIPHQPQKVPFSERQIDFIFTGTGAGCTFGTNEGMRQKQTTFCSVPQMSLLWLRPFAPDGVGVTPCEVCEWTSQSLKTQVLDEHGTAFTAVTLVHRVTEQTRCFCLLSLSLLVSCKITTGVHLAN